MGSFASSSNVSFVMWVTIDSNFVVAGRVTVDYMVAVGWIVAEGVVNFGRCAMVGVTGNNSSSEYSASSSENRAKCDDSGSCGE